MYNTWNLVGDFTKYWWQVDEHCKEPDKASRSHNTPPPAEAWYIEPNILVISYSIFSNMTLTRSCPYFKQFWGTVCPWQTCRWVDLNERRNTATGVMAINVYFCSTVTLILGRSCPYIVNFVQGVYKANIPVKFHYNLSRNLVGTVMTSVTDWRTDRRVGKTLYCKFIYVLGAKISWISKASPYFVNTRIQVSVPYMHVSFY